MLKDYVSGTKLFEAEAIHAAAESADIHELSALREILMCQPQRVPGNVDPDRCYSGLIEYYIKCIEVNPVATDLIHSRFEAAHELCRLFQKWQRSVRPPNASIGLAVKRIEELYMRGDEKVRNAIETGFLEHLFESPVLIPFFKHWESDQLLSEAFAAAMNWASGHAKSDLE